MLGCYVLNVFFYEAQRHLTIGDEIFVWLFTQKLAIGHTDRLLHAISVKPLFKYGIKQIITTLACLNQLLL